MTHSHEYGNASRSQASATLTPDTPPRPGCAYGRSKLAGEQAVLAKFPAGDGAQSVLLRLPPVYGAGMGGNLALLLRLARTPLPLPFGGIAGQRSLIAVEAVADAVATLLLAPHLSAQIYLASDAAPLTPGDVVAAFRAGLGRSPGLLAVPSAWLRAGAALVGKAPLWDGLAATQICDPSALAALGWTPRGDSRPGLAALAVSGARHG